MRFAAELIGLLAAAPAFIEGFAFSSQLLSHKGAQSIPKQGSPLLIDERQVFRPLSLSAVAAAVNGDSSSTTVADGAPSLSIRLNVNEKARTVASTCTSGTLCTVSGSEGIEGAPFGSFVDYVLDDEGNPVLLMNEMSMHTINIQENAMKEGGEERGGRSMVTLFTQLGGSGMSGPGGGTMGQDVSRCSITGTVEKIDENADDMATIRMRYSIAHSYADQVMDSPKFAFYRLLPAKVYYVGGFGVLAKWVPVDEYREAAPDILAKEASDIVARLNRDHAKDLSLTATHILDVDDIERIRVTGIDRLGLDIRVTKRGPRRNKLITDEFRIGFRIPVISNEDAKSEVLKIFQEAWEKSNGITWGTDDELPGSTIPIMKIAEDSLG